MDEFARKTYIREVGLQCRLATNAIASVDHLVQILDTGGKDVPTSQLYLEVFRGLHSFLTHVSNVSRLLWPPTPKRRSGESKESHDSRKQLSVDRGRLLREALKIPDDHVLRTRELRDHLEHFDERLDEWQNTTETRALIDFNIGPNIVSGVSDRDRLRNYDPGPALFTFRGETYKIKELSDAISEISARPVPS